MVLSDESLDETEQLFDMFRHVVLSGPPSVLYDSVSRNCLSLLAEVRRQLAEQHEMLEIVQAVADERGNSYNPDDYCGFCGSVDGAGHEPSCAVTKARAILARR